MPTISPISIVLLSLAAMGAAEVDGPSKADSIDFAVGEGVCETSSFDVEDGSSDKDEEVNDVLEGRIEVNSVLDGRVEVLED